MYASWCEGSVSASRKEASIAVTFGGTHHPNPSSFRTRHGVPIVAIAGSPAAIASATTIPKFSE
jgi:hypothetical protein